MKNFLEYYYNLLNITVHEKEGYYYFLYNNNYYVFLQVNRSSEEVQAIYKLHNNLKYYHRIILNRNNSPITYFNNRQYVLLKINIMNGKINYLDLKKQEVLVNREIQILLRNNWVELIEKKIDYFEYQRVHLKNEYKVLDESLDYFIGMAENAIGYLNNALASTKRMNSDSLVINHRRIGDDSKVFFYNPLNIVIDHSTRDVSGYLKYLFVSNSYNISILNEVINNLNLSSYGGQLLYGRMLYPSFYFDIYEKIINSGEMEKSSYSIITRMVEYEEYLSIIYKIINNNIKIPSIDWI